MIVRDSEGPLPPGRARLFGVYPASVVDVADPDKQGRVKVRLPWIAEADAPDAEAWARLSTMMAGNTRGTWFVPEPGDEVLVAFLAGDPRCPVVVGSLWNGQDAPPVEMDEAGENNIRAIKTESGHTLTFDDTAGAEKVTLVTAAEHQVVLDDGNQKVTVKHKTGGWVEIDSSGKITIHATGEVTVDAPMQMTVNTPQATFSGQIQCMALTTTSVVSATYSVGAGNVL